MKFKVVFFIIIYAISFACNNNSKSDSDRIVINTLSELTPGTDFSKKVIVLVIPFDGCNSCFNEATNLIPDVLNYSGIVILSNLLKKRIYNYLDNNDIGLNNKNIIIDTLQISITNKLIDFNPRIMLINKNTVIYSQVVSVKTIEDINKHLFN